MTTHVAKLEDFSIKEQSDWLRTLESCAPYDFYHLPQYHALAEDAGEGTPHLFVYTESAYTIALPLLLREIDGARSIHECQQGTTLAIERRVSNSWKDATSVYGYAGPVCSHSETPEGIVAGFQLALSKKLRELGVVSVFSRLHPLLPQRSLLAGLGEFRTSRTVSIDLTLDAAEQRTRYRKAHKEGINKLRRLGLTILHDVEGDYLLEFGSIYRETMLRVEASERYFFSDRYFEQLWRALGSRIHLFMCLDQGRPICGGLFAACHGIVQYHLGGTRNDALKQSPMKLLVDEVRLWANTQGMRVMHLGGGISADPEDSLLHYKTGFSDRTHEFATWRWILAPDVYAELCTARDRRYQAGLAQPRSSDFFPAYRAPVERDNKPMAPGQESGSLANDVADYSLHHPSSTPRGIP